MDVLAHLLFFLARAVSRPENFVFPLCSVSQTLYNDKPIALLPS